MNLFTNHSSFGNKLPMMVFSLSLISQRESKKKNLKSVAKLKRKERNLESYQIFKARLFQIRRKSNLFQVIMPTISNNRNMCN